MGERERRKLTFFNRNKLALDLPVLLSLTVGLTVAHFPRKLFRRLHLINEVLTSSDLLVPGNDFISPCPRGRKVVTLIRNGLRKETNRKASQKKMKSLSNRISNNLM